MKIQYILLLIILLFASCENLKSQDVLELCKHYDVVKAKEMLGGKAIGKKYLIKVKNDDDFHGIRGNP